MKIKREFYDVILQGSEATERQAYDYASQLDWGSEEKSIDTIENLKFIDTVNGIDIWYDTLADYYVFSDSEDDEIVETRGGKSRRGSGRTLTEMRKVFMTNLQRLEDVQHKSGNIYEDKRSGEIVMIKVNGDPYYIRYIDLNHLLLVNNLGAAQQQRGMSAHIRQYSDEPYYDDVRAWLRGELDTAELNGKEY